MHCTFCDTPMHEIEMRGVHVDHCPGCQGVFFDAKELATYSRHPEIESELRDASEAAPHRPSGRRCPRCEASSQVVTAPAAELDHCGLCGGFSLNLAALTAAATAALMAAPLLQQEAERTATNYLGDGIEAGVDMLDVGVEVADLALRGAHEASRGPLWRAGDGSDLGDALSGLADVPGDAADATTEFFGGLDLPDGGDLVGGLSGLGEGAAEAGGALIEGAGALAEGGAEVGGALLEAAAEGGGAALEIGGALAEGGGELVVGFFGFFFEVIGGILEGL